MTELAEVAGRQHLQDLCNQYDLELERFIKLGAGGADTFDEFKSEAKLVGHRVLAEYLKGHQWARSILNTRDVTACFDELLADSKNVFQEQKYMERLAVDLLLNTVLYEYTDRMGISRAKIAYIRADRLKQMHNILVGDLIREYQDRRGHLTNNKFTQLITDLLDTAYCTVKDDNDKNMPTVPAIGIYVGTTNSSVAYYRPDTRQVVVFESDTGRQTTPTVVQYRVEDGETIVGDNACDNIMADPRQLVYSVKRLIGRKFSSREVRENRDNWPFRVVDMGQDEPGVEVQTRSDGQTEQFLPEEVLAQVVKKMKENAEGGVKLGGDGQEVVIENCVITVPASFNNTQREATREAATMAGLNVLRVMNEPTAAALAYQLNRFENLRSRIVLVYHFGGSTFEVSILAIERGKMHVLEVNGDNHVGGDDLTNTMIDHCLAKFGGERVDKQTNEGSVALRRLKRECERRKIELSMSNLVTIKLDNLIGTRHMNIKITRQQFNDMCKRLFKRTMECVTDVIAKADKMQRDIDDVILVGGSTRIPYVKEMLGEYFDKQPCHTVNPDLVVAEGAAIQAAILNGKQARLSGTICETGIYLGTILDSIVPKPAPVVVNGDQNIGQKNTSMSSVENIYSLQFEELNEIGHGQFGIVFKARHKFDNKLYAVKRVVYNDQNKHVKNEVEYLTSLESQYVIKYYNSWSFDSHLYIQMEFCEQNLNKILLDKNHLFGHPSGNDIQISSCFEYYIMCEIFREMVECVQYLHECEPQIIHRDLKPDNVLIAHIVRNGRFIKLGDFGLATFTTNNATK